MSFVLNRYVVGPLQENCYLIGDATTKEAVLIDPGEEADRLLKAIDEAGLTLKEVWLTHAHFDHIGALAEIVNDRKVPFYLHPNDDVLLENAGQSAARWGIMVIRPPQNFVAIEENQLLSVGNFNFKCLYTPGHAPGHISFYCEQESLVIAGDALFKGSVGRTDLPFGNHKLLVQSIKSQLLTLPPETLVFPGHGPETSIEEETNNNPFLE